MEAFLWSLRTGRYPLGAMVMTILFVGFLLCWNYYLLPPWFLLRRALGLGRRGLAATDRLPALLVVIPSLLRKRDELSSMMSTVESVAANGYPGALTLVVTIDGTSDAPALWRELRAWAASRRWGVEVELHVTGTPGRRSKPMAIDHGMEYVKGLVAEGRIPAFPPVYVSTDADADLGPNALQAIVRRLLRRNPITGCPARVVAGALHVRGNAYWQGWRRFFTVAGQLNLQVAREYYVGNIWRWNIRPLPVTGVPGALYCTWSEIFLSIPKYMGYLQTLRLRHWLAWWVGVAPPRFSESRAEPMPELVAGDTDDTVTAYVASFVRWRDGHFVLDAPRTPLHALGYLLQSLLLDRPITYEPTARVFTSSPTTLRGLFKQRRRWNCSRIELTGRFFRAIAFHWCLGLPVLAVKVLLVRNLLVGAFVYFCLPFLLPVPTFLGGFALTLVCQIIVHGFFTLSALVVNGELRHWRIAFALPALPLYNFAFNWLPGAYGAVCDVLLCGNITGFSPEWTLKRGRSTRVALLFRLRRALLLAVRALVLGDVPLGLFWLGWRETPWTPSGYDGWTTGKRPRRIVPRPGQWLRGRDAEAQTR